MIDGENETIGILVYTDKDDAAEMTLEDEVKNVYA